MKEQIIKILQKHIFADGDIWVIYDLKKMYDDLLPVIDCNAEVQKRIAEKMVSERLREELGLYNDRLNEAAGKYLTNPFIDEYL